MTRSLTMTPGLRRCRAAGGSHAVCAPIPCAASVSALFDEEQRAEAFRHRTASLISPITVFALVAQGPRRPARPTSALPRRLGYHRSYRAELAMHEVIPTSGK
jgi:hypothetical protein